MNTYENAVPKPLKFLVSDGKLVDDAGNVIAESESLKDLYTKWAPEVKKYLLSDGSVVDEEGNLIIKNDYYKKIYDQADPKVANIFMLMELLMKIQAVVELIWKIIIKQQLMFQLILNLWKLSQAKVKTVCVKPQLH